MKRLVPDNLKNKKGRLRAGEEGFTLIETLVYVFALIFIMSVLIVVLFQLIALNESSRRSREAVSNARLALDAVAQEVRHAKGIYTPTSVFGTNPGQLSLETTRDLPAEEDTTYVDFYIDDSGLYLKREEQAAVLVTSEKIKITNFAVTELNSAATTPAVQIQLTAEYDSPVSGSKNTVSLETTASLRSY
ncbi:MAG: type II secretion system protein [bacterium]|nr:type II secretion system protein [bacterium]